MEPGHSCIRYSVREDDGTTSSYQETCNGKNEHWLFAEHPKMYERSQDMVHCSPTKICAVFLMRPDTMLPATVEQVVAHAASKEDSKVQSSPCSQSTDDEDNEEKERLWHSD